MKRPTNKQQIRALSEVLSQAHKNLEDSETKGEQDTLKSIEESFTESDD
jgi:hypothetical protein